MAMYGQGITRGRVGLLGIDAATNQACASITPKDAKQITSVFLYYFFEYHYENLRKLGHGAREGVEAIATSCPDIQNEFKYQPKSSLEE